MRICYKCKEQKDLTEFHKDKTQVGGHSYDCKKCKSETRKQKRKENPEKYREQCRKSTLKNYDEIRASQRKHKQENREKINARRRELREPRAKEINEKEKIRRKNDPTYLEKMRVLQKKNREKNKEINKPKLNAHKMVMFALKLGVIKKPEECTQCGSNIKIEGHHEDYSKPLEVIWLCKSCHVKRHMTKYDK